MPDASGKPLPKTKDGLPYLTLSQRLEPQPMPRRRYRKKTTQVRKAPKRTLRKIPTGAPTLADFDWMSNWRASHPRLLHAPTIEASAHFADGWTEPYSGAALCGLRARHWSIPSMSDRMHQQRCPSCCERMGYPEGKGSPKNDDACRPALDKRVQDNPET